jgi:pyruvate,water dikinase
MPRTFSAPAAGTWKQDSAHSPRPVALWKFDTFKDGFVRGFQEGTARFGLLFDYLEPAAIHGFLYYRDVLVDPSDAAEVGRRFAAAQDSFERKLWLEDLDRWDREVKPDSIRRNRALETTPMPRLDTEAFVRHLDGVRDNTAEMVYRHHIFTISSILPVGNYLANALEWTGLDPGVLLAPLKGSSQVSLGAHEEVREVGARLKEFGVGPESFAGTSAADTIAALKRRPDPLGAAVRSYFDAVGMRLASGYDLSDPCAFELPDMMLATIWASREEAPHPGAEGAEVRVRDAVPSAHRATFDELLDDARRINRLRDERGVYNDIWGNGIARQTLLEAGRRLVAAGQMDDAELALEGTQDELIAALRGATPAPADAWRERADWRRNAPLSEVPPFLGPAPSPPPPPDGLPPHAFVAMRAFGVALDEVFGGARESRGTTILGKPVSPGVYVGPGRLVIETSDMNRLTRGDVLVTSCTSAAFNVVLPLLGAIVTDRGGQLSHAAIVAREYGIPAVVGTLRSTTTIPDGARVEVDGTQGRVRLL